MVDLFENLKKEITEIINKSDLSNITPKSIRSSLEAKFNIDLTDRTAEINNIILQELSAKNDSTKVNNKNDNDDDDSSSSSSSDEIIDRPPVKKLKISDEELARKIHAEENRSRRSAATKVATKRNKKESNGTSSTSNKKSAFQKDCILSQPLSEIIGKDKCPRSEVVKSMWKYFKDNNLMDPKNKQFVLCDDKLNALFGKKKFKAFGMMKDLKRHIFDNNSV